MEHARKEKQHGFLERLIGTWTVSTPETEQTDWTETVRSLHGIWFIAEGEGEMPGGGSASTVMTLGYDPARGKYIGTWIGSMMNHMWVYEGDVAPDGDALDLYTTGPDMEVEGRTATYRETMTFTDEDNRTFTSSVQKPDGNWATFMTVTYKRRT